MPNFELDALRADNRRQWDQPFRRQIAFILNGSGNCRQLLIVTAVASTWCGIAAGPDPRIATALALLSAFASPR